MRSDSGFNRLLFAGLLLGILVATGISIFKTYLSTELTQLMNDEAGKSCDGCVFKTDSIRISLINLSATAKNARIEKDGISKLSFQRIRIYFDLSKILDRKINLSLISLENGLADGISDDSVTYKFIDQLSSSPPPAKRSQNNPPKKQKLSVKLIELKVKNSIILEKFSSSALRGNNFNLDLYRNAKDNFELRGTIEELKLLMSSNKERLEEYLLGKVSAQVELTEDFTKFLSAQLVDNGSKIFAHFDSDIAAGNQIAGGVKGKIDERTMRIDSFSKAEVELTGSMSGRLARPTIKGKLKKSSAQSDFTITPENKIEIDDIEGSYEVNFTDSGPALKTNLKLSNVKNNIKLSGPLEIDSDKISANFNLQADFVNVPAAQINNFSGQISISGTAADPEIKIQGLASSVDTIGIRVPDISLNTTIANAIVEIRAQGAATQSSRLNLSGEIYTNSTKNNQLKLDALNYPVLSQENTVLGKISGNTEIAFREKFNGQGRLNFQPVFTELPSSSLSGLLSIKDSEVTGAFSNQANNLKLNFKLDLENQKLSELDIIANEYWPDMQYRQRRCSSITATTKYIFSPADFFAGNGKLKLNNLSLGCAPRLMRTNQVKDYDIRSGKIIIPQLELYGKNSKIDLSGNIALKGDLDLQSSGSLELSALLPILKTVDDLRGLANVKTKISGNFANPELDGTAELLEAALSVESANLSLVDFNGLLGFKKTSIEAKSLTGELNQGEINLTGKYDFEDLSNSYLTANFSEINIQPDENTSVIISGNLALKNQIGDIPELAGEINLVSGVFEQEIKLRTIIAGLAKNLLSSRGETILPESSTKDYPDVNLAIKFKAERNFFIITNVVQSELAADLDISGNLNQPKLGGNIRSLSGWFGFGDKRFEIISSNLSFSPNNSTPILDVLGETDVLSQSGDLIAIFLEISGNLSNPNLRLSSDRNLSHNEVLALLGSSVKNINTTQVNLLGQDSSMLGFSLITEDPENSNTIIRLLSQLTKIDSISVEPGLNRQTGLVEPQFVARKNLSPKLILQGESFVGGAAGGSRGKLVYRLTPQLNLAGIVDSADTQRRSAVGFDITYTILAKRNILVSYEIKGNESFSRFDLLDTLRISENSRVAPEEIDFIKKRLHDFYLSQGFLDSTISLSCQQDAGICTKITISITENKPYIIEKIKLTRDGLPEELKKLPLDEIVGKIATKNRCEYLSSGIIRALRNEGYLQSRANCEYVKTQGNQVSAELKLTRGLPVSFVFVGNLEFTEKELLDTIRLFERKQPFGNNTINILTSKIQTFYRERGFLYATVRQELLEDNRDRAVYKIEISEGPKLNLNRIRFRGNKNLSLSFLKDEIKEISPQTYDKFFKERYAIENILKENTQILKNIYARNGYPHASISFDLKRSDNNAVDALYIVSEGSPEQLIQLDINVIDRQVTDEPKTDLPLLSSLQIKELLEDELASLRDQGYLHAEIIEDNKTNGTRTVKIKQGALTTVGKIKIRGNKTLSNQEILKKVNIHSGDAWSRKKLSEARSKLLRSGLIAQAYITPQDGQVDQSKEDLLIEITEKPLQTLEVGAGANSELGIHLFGEASDLSFFDDGRSINARVDVFYQPTDNIITQGTAGVSHYIPELFDQHSLNTDLRFQRFDLPTLPYNKDRLIWETTLYRAQKRGLSYDAGYSLFQDNLDSVNPAAILSDLDTGNIRLSKLAASIRYDQRDNPINPQKGFLLSFGSGLSSEYLGSEADFFQLNAKAGFLVPLFDSNFSIANYSQAAFAHAFASSPEVPLTERYFTGGRNSIRGFKENSIGPQADDGTVIGGDLLIVNNFEIRYRATPVTSLHIFLDAGNTFLEDQGIRYEDMRFSTGVGFRYLSPIGPLGFDLGRPIDEKEGEPSIRLHFSVGSAF